MKPGEACQRRYVQAIARSSSARESRRRGRSPESAAAPPARAAVQEIRTASASEKTIAARAIPDTRSIAERAERASVEKATPWREAPAVAPTAALTASSQRN